MPLESDAELRALLRGMRRVAVLGAKDDPASDAFRVTRRLQEWGYRVLPVNPKLERLLDVPVAPRLAELETPVDVVDVFRAPHHIPAHVDEILALPERPRAVWLQLGIRHDDAAQRLESAGLLVVQDRCLMLERARLLGDAPLAEG